MLSGDELADSILSEYVNTGHLLMGSYEKYCKGSRLRHPPPVRDPTGLLERHRWVVTGEADLEQFIAMARRIHRDPNLDVSWVRRDQSFYQIAALD